MNEAQVAATLRSRAQDTQRKRMQLDTSGGPPAKKSIVTKAWWAIKQMIPWGSKEVDEAESDRVITVEEEEKERDEDEEEEDEDEENGVEEDEDEEESEIAVLNGGVEEEESDNDEIEPLPNHNQSLNVQRVPEVVSMAGGGGSGTDEEEQQITREVREEEVLVVETPDKTTVYTRRISPLGAAATINVVTRERSASPEVLEVHGTASTPSSTSRTFSSSFPHPHILASLSPDVTTRVMEYVTEQSSRVVTATSLLNSTHSPSQSSTTSYDREKLRVGEEEGATTDRDSPLPEDSASRQVTPKSALGGTERSGYAGYNKRDTWKKNDKRERDPFRLMGRSKVIARAASSNLTKKTTEKLRSMNSHRHAESNPFDPSAKQRYAEILANIASQSQAAAASKAAARAAQLAQPFTFAVDLNTRQKMGLDGHKKQLDVAKNIALNALEELFPQGGRAVQQQEKDTEQAGTSRDSTIYLDDSSNDSYRSLNSTLSFHSVDKLSDLQSKIHEMSIISSSGRLQYDLYKGGKADFERTVDRLAEEGVLRTKHRLEAERLHAVDVRTRLAHQGIVIPEPEKVVDEFPELSDDAEELCRRVWTRGNEGEKFRGGDPPLTRKDLQTLYGPNWLNDEVILAYFNLIVERSQNDPSLPKTYAFNTFFYPNISNRAKGFASVKRWTRKVDIFSYDILLVPVHLVMHWTMAVVDVPAKAIYFYDSMISHHPEVVENIWKYLEAESVDKRKIALVPSEWERHSLRDIPQQQNGSDCGVFACKFADFASRRAPVTFDQTHMPYYRKRAVYQLCQNDLSAH